MCWNNCLYSYERIGSLQANCALSEHFVHDVSALQYCCGLLTCDTSLLDLWLQTLSGMWCLHLQGSRKSKKKWHFLFLKYQEYAVRSQKAWILSYTKLHRCANLEPRVTVLLQFVPTSKQSLDTKIKWNLTSSSCPKAMKNVRCGLCPLCITYSTASIIPYSTISVVKNINHKCMFCKLQQHSQRIHKNCL